MEARNLEISGILRTRRFKRRTNLKTFGNLRVRGSARSKIYEFGESRYLKIQVYSKVQKFGNLKTRKVEVLGNFTIAKKFGSLKFRKSIYSKVGGFRNPRSLKI